MKGYLQNITVSSVGRSSIGTKISIEECSTSLEYGEQYFLQTEQKKL